MRIGGLAVLAAVVVWGVGCGQEAPGAGGRPASVGGRRPAAALTTGVAEAVDYVYDGAGNLLEVRQGAASAPSIVDFWPRQGGVGQVVTVFGAGFGAVPSGNLLQLGGTGALVLSATAIELTFVVPAGAATGRIAVSVGGAAATSSVDFTVLSGVVISDFSPKVGRVGSILAVSGFNFSPVPSENAVTVGGGTASATSSSLTGLLATVGASATSGKVRVTVGASSATSADDFFLLPADYESWQVEFTARAAFGVPVAVVASSPGQAGLVLFDGEQGQAVTLYATGVTSAGKTQVTVYAPDGSSLFSDLVVSTHDSKFTLPPLPSTGTYTIVVQPEPGSAGEVELTVFLDAAAVAVLDGSACSLSLAAGQNGRCTFTAAAGDLLGFALTTFGTMPPGEDLLFDLRAPDGSRVWAANLLGTGSWQLPALSGTGLYTLLVQPQGTAGASVTVLLSRPLGGTLTTDGATFRFQSARPGQAGRYLFTGTAGQGFTLEVTPVAGWTGGGASVQVIAPGGAAVASGAITTGVGAKLDLGVLPVSGSYSVQVIPGGLAVGTLDLRFINAAYRTLTVGGPPQALALGTSQTGIYTFAASAGDALGLAMTTFATVPAGGNASLSVKTPSGTTLWTGAVSSPSSWQLPKLPTSGTYTLTVSPPGTAGAAFTVLLSAPLTGALAIDGAATTFETPRAGQSGLYTFTGAANELLGLGIPSLARVPPSGHTVLTVSTPSGSYLWSLSTDVASSGQLPKLPVTGTYTMNVAPPGVTLVTMPMQLSRRLTGGLATDGTPTRHESARVGQAGQYTFTGAAGDRFTLQATASSTVASSFTVNAYPPSGARIGYVVLSNSSRDGKADLGALPSSGTYTVEVIPDGVTTGPVDLRLVRLATGTLTVDSTPMSVSLGTAQNGRYTFSGSAGAFVGLAMTALAPTSAAPALVVTRPDGLTLWSITAASATSWQLPQLPTSGTYALAISPAGTASADLTVLLTPALTGNLTAGAAAVRHDSSAPGQPGRYAFSGSAGQYFTLRATAVSSLASGIAVAIYNPNGSTLASSTLSSGSDLKLALGPLPATGSYMVVLSPLGLTTGAADLRLLAVATGLMTIGDPLALALEAAQNGRYTFGGAAGDLLNLTLGSVVFTPVGTGALVVYRPDGGVLLSAAMSGPPTWQLPSLPMAGTYTVEIKPPGTSSMTATAQITRR